MAKLKGKSVVPIGPIIRSNGFHLLRTVVFQGGIHFVKKWTKFCLGLELRLIGPFLILNLSPHL